MLPFLCLSLASLERHRASCKQALIALGVEQHDAVNIFGFNAPEWSVRAPVHACVCACVLRVCVCARARVCVCVRVACVCARARACVSLSARPRKYVCACVVCPGARRADSPHARTRRALSAGGQALAKTKKRS